MPEQNFDETIISSGDNSFNIKLLVVLIIILLLAGVGMGYYLYTKRVINIPSLQGYVPPPGPLPESVKAKVEYNFQPTCDVQEDGLLIIGVANIFDNHRAITLKGTISKVELVNPETFSIVLTSDLGEKSVQFNVKDLPNLVFTALDQKPMKLLDLKVTDVILVSYNCDPQKNITPVITRIQKL